MWHNTAVSRLLKIQYPIIQGPFGGRFSSVKLVSTVSNLGGMGSFGMNAYGPDEILLINREILAHTNQPYALNLWVPLQDDPAHAFTEKHFQGVRESFRPHFEKVGAAIPQQMKKEGQSFEAQVEAILKAAPPVVSFIYGIPSSEIIEAFKRRNVVTIAVATHLAEAEVIESAGVDLVVASGMEAGGHRASFLDAPEQTMTPTATLVEEIKGKVKIPIIAAGGISTGQDVADMLSRGAAAVQLGTAFLATEESNASLEHRAQLLSDTRFETQLTNVFTGRLARVIKTDFVKEMAKEQLQTAPYPIQSAFLSPLRKAATAKGWLDYEAFWSGQPSTRLEHRTTSGLFASLLTAIDNVYQQS